MFRYHDPNSEGQIEALSSAESPNMSSTDQLHNRQPER